MICYIPLNSLLVLVSRGITSSSLLQGAALYTAWSATGVRRLARVVDVVLRLQADQERRDVDQLAADSVNDWNKVGIFWC